MPDEHEVQKAALTNAGRSLAGAKKTVKRIEREQPALPEPSPPPKSDDPFYRGTRRPK